MSDTDHVMLVKVSADENNNKFYELTLDASGLVTARYGRVGTPGQITTYRGGQHKFDSQMSSKMRRGYSKVDVADGPGRSRSNSSDLITVARKKIVRDPSDTNLLKLIDSMCAANRHNIETTSGGVMTVSDDGAVSTPVGLISAQAISEARGVLAQIAAKPTVSLVEQYLTLVPQKVGHQRGWADEWMKPQMVASQYDFLDQLDGSVAMAASLNPGAGVDADFRYSLARIDPTSAKFDEIQERFSRGKNSRHTSSNLSLVGLYAMVHTNVDEPVAWKAEADAKGNVRRLWHGTREFNLLSMLHRGFVIQPSRGSGTQVITGRMFGDGVYFSDQSTKSLNYSQGYWSGGARTNHCFMFLADVVMGKSYAPKSSGTMTEAHTGGYDSINVKGGTAGVLNNEMIVWRTEQIRLSYLCEFS